MQSSEEGAGASAQEPSRRQPLRARSLDAVPIPEAARARRTSTKVASPRANGVDSRIEHGLREIGVALTETLQVAAAEAARAVQSEDPSSSPGEAAESLRAMATQLDERLQAIAVRMDKLEDALRAVAARAAAREEVTKRLDEIGQGLTRLAAHQQRGMVRLAQFQQQGLARLATQHRSDLRDLARLTGKGVVAVSRKVRDDLSAAIARLETQETNGHDVEVIGDVPPLPERVIPDA